MKRAGAIWKGRFIAMKSVKKMVCLALVLVCVFSVAVTAFAMTGYVVGGRLNLRKLDSTSSTIIGYIPNGSTVMILDNGDITNGFYHINAPCYKSGQTAADCVFRTGYGMQKYITLGSNDVPDYGITQVNSIANVIQ